jgi:hypothetical protein
MALKKLKEAARPKMKDYDIRILGSSWAEVA